MSYHDLPDDIVRSLFVKMSHHGLDRDTMHYTDPQGRPILSTRRDAPWLNADEQARFALTSSVSMTKPHLQALLEEARREKRHLLLSERRAEKDMEAVEKRLKDYDEEQDRIGDDSPTLMRGNLRMERDDATQRFDDAYDFRYEREPNLNVFTRSRVALSSIKGLAKTTRSKPNTRK